MARVGVACDSCTASWRPESQGIPPDLIPGLDHPPDCSPDLPADAVLTAICQRPWASSVARAKLGESGLEPHLASLPIPLIQVENCDASLTEGVQVASCCLCKALHAEDVRHALKTARPCVVWLVAHRHSLGHYQRPFATRSVLVPQRDSC